MRARGRRALRVVGTALAGLGATAAAVVVVGLVRGAPPQQETKPPMVLPSPSYPSFAPPPPTTDRCADLGNKDLVTTVGNDGTTAQSVGKFDGKLSNNVAGYRMTAEASPTGVTVEVTTTGAHVNRIDATDGRQMMVGAPGKQTSRTANGSAAELEIPNADIGKANTCIDSKGNTVRQLVISTGMDVDNMGGAGSDNLDPTSTNAVVTVADNGKGGYVFSM